MLDWGPGRYTRPLGVTVGPWEEVGGPLGEGLVVAKAVGEVGDGLDAIDAGN